MLNYLKINKERCLLQNKQALIPTQLQEDLKCFEERKDKLKEDFINEKLSTSDYSELKGDLEVRIAE